MIGRMAGAAMYGTVHVYLGMCMFVCRSLHAHALFIFAPYMHISSRAYTRTCTHIYSLPIVSRFYPPPPTHTLTCPHISWTPAAHSSWSTVDCGNPKGLFWIRDDCVLEWGDGEFESFPFRLLIANARACLKRQGYYKGCFLEWLGQLPVMFCLCDRFIFLGLQYPFIFLFFERLHTLVALEIAGNIVCYMYLYPFQYHYLWWAEALTSGYRGPYPHPTLLFLCQVLQ